MNLGFLGEYEYKVDSKGRLAIPKPFVQNLPSENDQTIRKLVAFGMLETHILLYSAPEWVKFSQPILSSHPFNKDRSQQIREFFQYVTELELDGQNRIMLPKRFIERASIKKEVMFLGVNNKIELWDKAAYEKVIEKTGEIKLDNFAQLYEDFNGGGTPRAK